MDTKEEEDTKASSIILKIHECVLTKKDDTCKINLATLNKLFNA